MVAVLPRHRRREAGNEPGLGLPDYQFEAAGGKVMTFINDHMPIVPDTVVDDSLADHALYKRHVDNACWLLSPAADPADVARW